MLIIRYVLSTENKRRDRERLDNSYDDIYYTGRMGKDGQVERVKVDKEFLDLTDIQNRDFRLGYSLGNEILWWTLWLLNVRSNLSMAAGYPI